MAWLIASTEDSIFREINPAPGSLLLKYQISEAAHGIRECAIQSGVPGQRLWPHLGACCECSLSGPTPDLLNQHLYLRYILRSAALWQPTQDCDICDVLLGCPSLPIGKCFCETFVKHLQGAGMLRALRGCKHRHDFISISKEFKSVE